jgi:hypothetical protein
MSAESGTMLSNGLPQSTNELVGLLAAHMDQQNKSHPHLVLPSKTGHKPVQSFQRSRELYRLPYGKLIAAEKLFLR